MDRFRHTALLSLFFIFTLVSLASSSVGKNKNAERIGRTREQYLSKSYGEIQFNKYKGQLPPKGSILSCAIECMTLATCHCLALNIHTAECSFFDMDHSPDYANWKVDSNSSGIQDLNLTSESNYINNDFIFFTRDILDPNQPSKLDISSNRKWTTSSNLDQYYGKDGGVQSTPTVSNSKQPSTGKGNKNNSSGSKQSKNSSSAQSLFKASKSASKAKNSRNDSGNSSTVIGGQFPFPYLQIEFKDSMYLTEVAFQATRAIDDLKHFQIRIGDEPITKFYEDVPSAPTNAKPFTANRLCFEYESTSKGFFEFAAVRKQNSFVKSVKCRPCGLKGRYLIIQAMAPCGNCRGEEKAASESKTVKSSKDSHISTSASTTNFPFAVSNIEVYGYPITA